MPLKTPREEKRRANVTYLLYQLIKPQQRQEMGLSQRDWNHIPVCTLPQNEQTEILCSGLD